MHLLRRHSTRNLHAPSFTIPSLSHDDSYTTFRFLNPWLKLTVQLPFAFSNIHFSSTSYDNSHHYLGSIRPKRPCYWQLEPHWSSASVIKIYLPSIIPVYSSTSTATQGSLAFLDSRLPLVSLYPVLFKIQEPLPFCLILPNFFNRFITVSYSCRPHWDLNLQIVIF